MEYNMSHTGQELDDAINKVQSGYILPSGTLDIASNGTKNVKEYESVNVNVPIPPGYIIPSGTLNITSNGTHDVKNYASANVNVPVLNPLMHVTQSDSGSFTPSSDVTVSGYFISTNFKPKFFVIYNSDAIKNPASGTTGNSTYYYLQMSYILTDNDYNRIGRGSVFVSYLRESSTNYGRGGIGTSAYPAVTDSGVTLSTSLSNLKLKGGVPYSWFAWG